MLNYQTIVHVLRGIRDGIYTKEGAMLEANRCLKLLESGGTAPIFRAWVVLDEHDKAIAYLDESLGDFLEASKKYHERKNYRIIELTGEIK